MGQFGSDTSKPLDLVSSFPYIECMRRKNPGNQPGMSLVTKSSDGKRVAGKMKELYDSAAYTYEFVSAYASGANQYLTDVKNGCADNNFKGNIEANPNPMKKRKGTGGSIVRSGSWFVLTDH